MKTALCLMFRFLPLLAVVVASFQPAFAAEPAAKAAHASNDADFGRNVTLEPFVVKGEKIALSVHARTESDRRYGRDFGEDVLGIAFETMGKSTGAGLVIVGRAGEPHPVELIRRLVARADGGGMDPRAVERVRALDAQLREWKLMFRFGDDGKPTKSGAPNITFDTIMPALPVPLKGAAAQIYQIGWAERFDDERIAARLAAAAEETPAVDAFAKYDWVFYLPPRNAAGGVIDDVVTEVMKHEKMGVFKRAAVRSAMLVFRPAIKKAVEGFRKGMLFTAVLDTRSGWSKEDIRAVTNAYLQALMPDFKFNDGEEQTHDRIMAAINQQKEQNAEHARNPFVAPPRLASFDPEAYAPCVGRYGTLKRNKDEKVEKPSRELLRQDQAWLWRYRGGTTTTLHPAGERLFVSDDAKLTVEFKVDDQGAVTAAEERRVRYRQGFPLIVAAKTGAAR